MIGLKDTLTLLKSGMTLQEIKEREALDNLPGEEAKEKDPEPKTPEEGAAPAEDPAPEIDYKAEYEKLLKEKEKTEADLTALQQENVHKNMGPEVEEALKKQTESLHNMARSFM